SKILFSKNNQKTGLIKLNWQISPEHLLTLSSVYGIHKGWEPFAAKRDILPKPSLKDIMSYGADIAWKRKLVYRDQKDENYTLKYNYLPENNPWINLSTQFSYSKTTQNDTRPEKASSVFLGTLGNQSWITYSDLTFDINNTSTFNIKSTRHELLFGLQWLKNTRHTLMYDKSKVRKADYNYGYFQPYYMPSGRQYTQAFYLQDQIKWKNIIFSTGVRYDHINNIGQKNLAPQYNDISAGHNYSQKNYNGWSYYLGLKYDVNHYLSLFTNFSRTWRAPVIDEQYETQYKQSSGPVTATSLNLEKEMINQTRVGGIITLNHLFQENDAFQFRTTYFYNRGKNEIFKTRGVNCVGNAADTNHVCPKPIGNYRNFPGYVIQGAELEAYYQSTYLFGELTYSYVKGKRDTSPRNPWGKTSTWIAEIPPRKATTALGFNIPKYNFTAGWRAEFVRRQDRSPLSGDPKASYWSLPASKGYSLHSLFLSWTPEKIKGMNIKITVDNLFNRAYNPYLGELASGTGRNIKFSLSQKF
ncbi:TPA: TonB-dependent receptor, partial [Haemophilus influenzae]